MFKNIFSKAHFGASRPNRRENISSILSIFLKFFFV